MRGELAALPPLPSGDYADQCDLIRIAHDGSDAFPWQLDAVDTNYGRGDTGANGYRPWRVYSEQVRNFQTWTEALEAVPAFIIELQASGTPWVGRAPDGPVIGDPDAPDMQIVPIALPQHVWQAVEDFLDKAKYPTGVAPSSDLRLALAVLRGDQEDFRRFLAERD